MSGNNGKSGEIGVPPEALAAEAGPGPGQAPPGAAHAAAEGVEPDAPPTGKLFLQIAVLGVIVVGLLIGLWQYFKLDTADEIYRKELSVPNRELEELIARDEGRLTAYDVVDETKGIYQIPVRRAMEMIVEEPSLLAPVASAPAPPREGGGEGASTESAGGKEPARDGEAKKAGGEPQPARRGGGSPLLDPAPDGESK